MNSSEFRSIAEGLIETTSFAGKKSIEIYKKGLKKIMWQVVREVSRAQEMYQLLENYSKVPQKLIQ